MIKKWIYSTNQKKIMTMYLILSPWVMIMGNMVSAPSFEKTEMTQTDGISLEVMTMALMIPPVLGTMSNLMMYFLAQNKMNSLPMMNNMSMWMNMPSLMLTPTLSMAPSEMLLKLLKMMMLMSMSSMLMTAMVFFSFVIKVLTGVSEHNMKTITWSMALTLLAVLYYMPMLAVCLNTLIHSKMLMVLMITAWATMYVKHLYTTKKKMKKIIKKTLKISIVILMLMLQMYLTKGIVISMENEEGTSGTNYFSSSSMMQNESMQSMQTMMGQAAPQQQVIIFNNEEEYKKAMVGKAKYESMLLEKMKLTTKKMEEMCKVGNMVSEMGSFAYHTVKNMSEGGLASKEMLNTGKKEWEWKTQSKCETKEEMMFMKEMMIMSKEMSSMAKESQMSEKSIVWKMEMAKKMKFLSMMAKDYMNLLSKKDLMTLKEMEEKIPFLVSSMKEDKDFETTKPIKSIIPPLHNINTQMKRYEEWYESMWSDSMMSKEKWVPEEIPKFKETMMKQWKAVYEKGNESNFQKAILITVSYTNNKMMEMMVVDYDSKKRSIYFMLFESLIKWMVEEREVSYYFLESKKENSLIYINMVVDTKNKQISGFLSEEKDIEMAKTQMEESGMLTGLEKILSTPTLSNRPVEKKESSGSYYCTTLTDFVKNKAKSKMFSKHAQWNPNLKWQKVKSELHQPEDPKTFHVAWDASTSTQYLKEISEYINKTFM